MRWPREARAKDSALPVVLVVGRLTRYKGAARVVDALPLCGETRLVVIGSGPEASAIDGLAERLGVRAKRCLLGTVDDVELASR